MSVIPAPAVTTTKKLPGDLTGILAAVVAPALSSFAWITQGEATRSLGPLVFLFYAHLLTALLLRCYLIVFRTMPKMQLVLPHRKDLLKLVLMRGRKT